MFQSKRRWRRQPAPVLDLATIRADLLREGAGKHDDRRMTA